MRFLVWVDREGGVYVGRDVWGTFETEGELQLGCVCKVTQCTEELPDVIAIDAPNYLRGKAVIGPLPTDVP